jgi:PAS domain S-box-containing protein
MKKRSLGARRLAFRHQLALVVALTSALAVGLAALGSFWLETQKAYSEIRQEHLPVARIIATNSIGALSFNDARAARETLGALAIHAQIACARLYDERGQEFATYRRAGNDSDPIPAAPEPAGHRFERGHFVLFENIAHDGERVGALYMKVDTGPKLKELWHSALLLALVFLASSGAALLVSTVLQRSVSRPILELVRAAWAVTERRDYSIRVQHEGPVELLALSAAFNEMLSQIEERDAALRAARDELEARVEERVRDLQREMAERRRAEAESRRRAERLQLQGAALESTADAVVITDREGVIQWTNSSFAGLAGYPAEEAVGRSVMFLRSDRLEDARAYREMIRTVRAGGVWKGEMVQRRKDGRLYPVEQTTTPVRGEQGKISHFVAVIRDVTQARRLEQQFRQAQKMEAVGRLSGGVAHDFNNLLNVVMGFTEMMIKGLPDDERLRRYGQQVLKAAQRGAGLTRQLLAFSRQQVLQPRVLDLNGVIAEIEKMLSRLIGEDIEIATSAAPGLGLVEVDPNQIEQVLMNLVVNARDAMPDGGTLTIETANVEVNEAEASQYDYPVQPGPYVALVVRDTGTGMNAETLSHVFEPFFTTKGVGNGTGLGLATVYGIVKQSKGYIWVTSKVGRGSAFRILLPRLPAQTAAAAATSRETAPEPLGRGTVLLVEDDDAARGLWHEMLEMLGYRVLEAANGVQALEVARAHAGPIHLLLSDVVMPRLGGRELAEKLRADRPDVRVIFMSGYSPDTALRQGVLASGWAFLQKPFTTQALAKTLRETLESAVRPFRRSPA